ncbi:MAG TPA: response regulator [Candidatus Acidoferrales bacterium]|nr:response regulator [Candidatus Acidoferrales bacterium]
MLADDNELIRSGLRSLLQEHGGWLVCAEATDGRDALEKAIRFKPDVILVDAAMPHLSGFEVAGRIHEQLPDSEIVIVTEHDARTLAHIQPQPGVRGYAMKSRLSYDLLAAVEAASKHQPVSLPASA